MEPQARIAAKVEHAREVEGFLLRLGWSVAVLGLIGVVVYAVLWGLGDLNTDQAISLILGTCLATILSGATGATKQQVAAAPATESLFCRDCRVRTPKPNCAKCRAFRKSRAGTPEREPGVESPAKRKLKSGQPVYDLKEYASIFGALYRQVDRVRDNHRLPETPQSETLQRELQAWDQHFREWLAEITKPAKAKG